MSKQTKVTLLSWTTHPVETVYLEWQQSRTEEHIPTASELHYKIVDERGQRQALAGQTVDPNNLYLGYNPGPLEAEVRKVFEQVVSMKMPLTETVEFVFLIENMPIALREQIVRHRVGHRFGPGFGADMIPDPASSTFWSQTMRIRDVRNFAENGDYYTPATVSKREGKEYVDSPLGYETNATAVEYYNQCMKAIGQMYQTLMDAYGLSVEDARNVMPLAFSHRMIWKMSFASLLHVFSKRGCWIIQMGMWESLIRGVVNELANKVDPFFRRIIAPPCIDGTGKFNTCAYKLEQQNRVHGEDPMSPCPLFLYREPKVAREGLARAQRENVNPRWVPADSPIAGLGWRPAKSFEDYSIQFDIAAESEYVERMGVFQDLWAHSPLYWDKDFDFHQYEKSRDYIRQYSGESTALPGLVGGSPGAGTPEGAPGQENAPATTAGAAVLASPPSRAPEPRPVPAARPAAPSPDEASASWKCGHCRHVNVAAATVCGHCNMSKFVP